MGVQFGTVAEHHDPSGALIVVGNGQQHILLSAEQLKSLGCPALQVGQRVRLTVQAGKVEKLVVMQPPGVNSIPDSVPASQETAKVVGADPHSRTLVIRLESGRLETVQLDLLSETTWNSLQPGAVVRLRREQASLQIDLPKQSVPFDSVNLPSQKTSLSPTWSSQVDGRLMGSIAQTSVYFTTVKGDNGKFYNLSSGHFLAQSFSEGDRVIFDADEQSGEVKSIALVERKPKGRGYLDPCKVGLAELLLDTKRPALVQLARHFCEENRIEWYWITPEQPAKYDDRKHILSPSVTQAIKAVEKFDTFYSHQARSLDALKRGRHVLVLTPTASGKTYCYNPAVFDALQGDPTATALYVFPLNALLMDQMKKLESIGNALREQGIDIPIERLIGKLEQEERKQISENPPQILAVNPEKLNDLLYENTDGNWGEFLRRLRYVVLDEVHSYRSLFGLQMAGILRRLQIACQRYHNRGFQFVLSSATVGAPEELVTRLTGLPINGFDIIRETDDGSMHHQRHWMMLAPDAVGSGNLQDAHIHQAALALTDVLTVPKESLNAIVFARSFREVRMIHAQVQKNLRERGRIDLVPKVEKYASGLMDMAQKKKVYEGLDDGTYQAVVSTNALEAGIDIKRLDVCIIAGFPFHMMRLRQMAGRAGRKGEGAVIYIPSAVHSLDRFYRSQPERLLTQPAESFVIDAENPSVVRKHVVAAASSMSAGVTREELSAFGARVDEIIDKALTEGVIEPVGLSSYTSKKRWDRSDSWAVGNLRSNEQTPYVLCSAAADQQHCIGTGCPAVEAHRTYQKAECPHFVQTLDRQYVYREAHPGAIYEALESGTFYQVADLHDDKRVVSVQPIDETMDRTFGVEDVSIHIRQERERRELGHNLTLAWGEVTVTRTYSGYFDYTLIPRRWCKQCRRSQETNEIHCSECGRKTVSYLDKTPPKYHDYPKPNEGKAYTLTLNTIACWLTLPAEIETALKPVSRCKIPSPQNQVSHFLQTPAFGTQEELGDFFKISPQAAQVAFDYFEDHHKVFFRQKPPKGKQPVYPIYYGQCLHEALRSRLPESEALAVFQTITGYPVVKDERHICRNCIGSTLLPAAHTLEHLIAKRYPAVALGDSQDLSSSTMVLHPQTRSLTVFWFDNYEGGIGAAEKIYSQFNRLLQEGLIGLDCDCEADHGCPLCIQQSYCDRENDALSKVAARALINYMQGNPISIPIDLVYWDRRAQEDGEQKAKQNERSKERIPTPEEHRVIPIDPFALLQVQRHVHNAVLAVAEKIRSEELEEASPPIPLQIFQQACEQVKQSPRPNEWRFPDDWDDYQLLHIDPQASKKLGNKARNTILMHVHPDHNTDHQWANEVTKRINNAWERIKNT